MERRKRIVNIGIKNNITVNPAMNEIISVKCNMLTGCWATPPILFIDVASGTMNAEANIISADIVKKTNPDFFAFERRDPATTVINEWLR